jgi:hypothetical protein
MPVQSTVSKPDLLQDWYVCTAQSCAHLCASAFPRCAIACRAHARLALVSSERDVLALETGRHELTEEELGGNGTLDGLLTALQVLIHKRIQQCNVFHVCHTCTVYAPSCSTLDGLLTALQVLIIQQIHATMQHVLCLSCMGGLGSFSRRS